MVRSLILLIVYFLGIGAEFSVGCMGEKFFFLNYILAMYSGGEGGRAKKCKDGVHRGQSFCQVMFFIESGYFAVTIHESLNKHICYNARSNAVVWWVVLLPSNAMVRGLSLCRQSP